MADTLWFEITEGEFALALVDTDAPGYSASWMAPSGLTVDAVSLATYDMPVGTSWQCQVTSGALTPRSNTTTRNRVATFCNPSSTATAVSASSWTLDATLAQDPHVAQGLARFLFEHDAEEAYFMLGLNGGDPPVAIGRVTLAASQIGGAARTDLTATVSMTVNGKPSIEFGDADASEVVD